MINSFLSNTRLHHSSTNHALFDSTSSPSANAKHLFSDLPVVEEYSLSSSEVRELPSAPELRADFEFDPSKSNARSYNPNPGIFEATLAKSSKSSDSFRLEAHRNTLHSIGSIPPDANNPNPKSSEKISASNVFLDADLEL